MTLHQNIRRLRQEMELSVSAAAVAAGLNRVAWTEIEAGRNPNPTAATLSKIAGALGLTVADLWVDADGESVTVSVVAPCPECGREIEGRKAPLGVYKGTTTGGPVPKVPPPRWAFECPDCGHQWLAKD